MGDVTPCFGHCREWERHVEPLQEALSEAAEALGVDCGTRHETLAERITAIRGERDALKAEVERLEEDLVDLDEQNMMQQDYLRQIRDAAYINDARGLALEAIERSR